MNVNFQANVLLWENGRCQVVLDLEEQHTNIRGTLHTGMALMIADVTAALALFSHPKVLKNLTYPYNAITVPSTATLNFSYVKRFAVIRFSRIITIEDYVL